MFGFDNEMGVNNKILTLPHFKLSAESLDLDKKRF